MRLGKSVRKVSLVKPDSSNVIVLHRGKKDKKKKGSRELEPMERAVRRFTDANTAGVKSYSARHRKSNRKKRDGWARDLPLNLMRASRTGWKKL